MNFEKIPRAVLKRNVTVLMSLIAVFVIGLIAMSKIKLEFMPNDLIRPAMGVWLSYRNSTPEEVERVLADLVEPEMATVPGVKDIYGNIRANGMFVFMSAQPGTDMDQMYLDILDRMERLKPLLPEESQRYRIRRWRPGSDSEYELFIVSKNNTGNEQNFVQNFLVPRFDRIDGVANVEFDTSGEKSIYIYVNNDLIKAYRVNLAQVIGKLRQDNFTMTSGYVYEGNQKIFVRSRSKIYDIETLRNLVINERGLKLRDIATVEFDTGENERLWHVDGQNGMELEIAKEKLANTIEVTNRIDAEVQKLKNHPRVKAAGLELIPIFNQGKYIKQSVFNLLESGLWGGLFAFIFIFAFLRRFRMTAIITMAIPASIMMAIITLFFMGKTLNGLSMMGLLIAVGLVVDSAIVIVENIYRKKQEGASNTTAAIKGTSEVGLAITLSTLTTVAIFMPIFFFDKNSFFGFMQAIALPVVAALMAALLVAIVYIPYTSTRITSNKAVETPAWLKRISESMANLTSYFVRRRVDGFIVMFILIAMLGVPPFPNMSGNNDGNINDFRYIVDLPDNYTFSQTQKLVKALEQKAEEKRDVYQIKSYSVFARKTFISFKVFLEDKVIPPWYMTVYRQIRGGLESLGVPKLDQRMTLEEVKEDFKKLIPDLPGVRIRTSWRDEGVMKADASLTIQLEGDETEKLLQIAREVERRFQTVPTVTNTDINLENGQDEVKIRLDREKLKMYDLDPNTTRQIVDFNLRGVRFRNFQNQYGEETSIYVQARREDRERLEQLKNLVIFNGSGQQIPLYSVADFSIEKGIGNIRHENGKTVLQVKAVLGNEDEVNGLRQNLETLMAGLQMPFGYKWGLGRIAKQQEEQKNDLQATLWMGIIIIFLLMAVLFESVITPFSIIISIPLGFLGSKFLLLLTGTDIDLMAMIGLVVLVGIVVNNGIVLIDAVIRYRREGMNRADAIHRATLNRVRPIMLTAITTIGGLLPMALGETEFIGIQYAPMGKVILGGLVASTFLTLIFTPLIYTWLDDVAQVLSNIFKQLFVRGDNSAAGLTAPELRNKID